MKKITYLFTILFAFTAMSTYAQVTSAASGDWNVGATWAGGVAPGPGDNVIIATGHNIIVSGSSLSNNLTMNGTSNVTINAGGLLNVDGDFNFNSTGSVIFDGGGEINFKTITSSTITATTVLNFNYIGANGINGIVRVGTSVLPATVTIAPASQNVNIHVILAVENGSLVTNNKLVLKATSPTAFARVALNDGILPSAGTPTIYTGTITGNVTMEKVFHASSLTSAFPITGSKYLGKWFQMCFPLQTTVGSADWTGITLNHAGVTGTPRNVYWWDASEIGATGNAVGWTIASGADNQSKAYTVFLTSDGPFTTSSSISTKGTVNLNDLNGIQTPYTKDINNPGGILAEGTGWSLLRNPWPSSLNFDEVMLSGAADFNINYFGYHVYNTTTASNLSNTTGTVIDQYTGIPISSFGAGTPYVDYNGTGGFITTGLTTRRIHPFQAFWVRANAVSEGPVNLRAKYASTDIDVNSVYMKTNSATPPTAVVFAYDVDSLKDITLVYYRTQATKGFDLKGDIFKMRSTNPSVPTLFISEAGSSAQSCGRPDLAIDTVVLNYASSKNNTTAYLFLNDTVLGSQYQVTLYDKVTQTTTNFNQNPSYMFTHNVNNPEDRFEMYITNNAISVGENNLTAKEVKVYLAGDELVVSSESYTGVANLNIFDLGGRLIISRQIELTEGVDLRVQMASMANSMYTVEVTYNGKVFVEKLVK